MVVAGGDFDAPVIVDAVAIAIVVVVVAVELLVAAFD